MDNTINVMVVDDSALVRQSLVSILTEEDGFSVVTASNPIFAQRKMLKLMPDVMILDIEMPEMDGLTFLRKLMSSTPLPVVICSGVTQQGSDIAFSALELGAVEIIEKPKLGTRQFLEESTTRIIDAVHAALYSKKAIRKISLKAPSDVARLVAKGPGVPKKKRPLASNIPVQPKLTADAVLSLPAGRMTELTEKVIVVGASTGGTEALKDFLTQIPPNTPPILIVQHMPKHFTKAFANRLNSCCPPQIMEAENGMEMKRGVVCIAPGDSHLLLTRKGKKYFAEVRQGPLVCRHRPSVDVLFRSAARYAGSNAVGVIMTGMGDDGARGMLEMKESGAKTIAQNEQSCVVYGMPKEAVKRNAADHILPLTKIAEKALALCLEKN